MPDPSKKDYLAVVQCHLVMQRCSGYYCELALNERSGGFTTFPVDKPYRAVYLTCGGCCGRALGRKLSDLVRQAGKREGIGRERIGVWLASCITRDNYHGPPCPHVDYLKTLIARLGLDVFEDTNISRRSQERRERGIYRDRPPSPPDQESIS
jgi:predicted metal-binding protein